MLSSHCTVTYLTDSVFDMNHSSSALDELATASDSYIVLVIQVQMQS